MQSLTPGERLPGGGRVEVSRRRRPHSVTVAEPGAAAGSQGRAGTENLIQLLLRESAAASTLVCRPSFTTICQPSEILVLFSCVCGVLIIEKSTGPTLHHTRPDRGMLAEYHWIRDAKHSIGFWSFVGIQEGKEKGC